MSTKSYRVYAWSVIAGFVSLLTVALLRLDVPGDERAIRVGYVLGSLFAHTTLAAAYFTFGHRPLSARLPVSLGWVAMLPAVVGINVVIHGDPKNLLILGVSLFSQWLLLQFSLWTLVLGLGIQLSHSSEDGHGRRNCQFGIRQLLIVTAIIAALLGTGRIVLGNMPEWGGEMPILIFLAVAAIVLTLPVLLASLIRDRTAFAILLAILFVSVATLLELRLLNVAQLDGARMAYDIATNVSSTAITLVGALIVRANGYCLYLHKSVVERTSRQ